MNPEPDGFLGGRLRLIQPPRGAHRAGTDAVFLARLVAPEAGM
ncbi:methyltransferase, partial [Methylobacterium trifolii]